MPNDTYFSPPREQVATENQFETAQENSTVLEKRQQRSKSLQKTIGDSNQQEYVLKRWYDEEKELVKQLRMRLQEYEGSWFSMRNSFNRNKMMMPKQLQQINEKLMKSVEELRKKSQLQNSRIRDLELENKEIRCKNSEPERETAEQKKTFVGNQKMRTRSSSSSSLSKIEEDDEYETKQLYQREKNLNEKLKNQIKEIKTEFQAKEYMVRGLLKENKYIEDESQKKIEKLQEEIEQLKKQQRGNSQTEELQKKNDELSRRLLQKDEEIAQLKEKFSDYDQKSTLSDSKVEELSALLQQKEEETQKQVGQMAEQLKCLSEQIQRLKSALEEKVKENSSLNKLCKELEQNFTASKNGPESDFIQRDINPVDSMKIDSKVVVNLEQYLKLIGMFGNDRRPKGFKLLFRASNYGFDAKNTKEKYCGVAHTVLLVKTQYGKVIGGYTPLKWKIPKHTFQYQLDTSGESFVFSISNNHKFNLLSAERTEAVCHWNEQGPQFFGAISITDKSNTEDKSYSLSEYSLHYVHPKYKGCDEESWMKFVGSSNGQFYTLQWEMHEVIFE